MYTVEEYKLVMSNATSIAQVLRKLYGGAGRGDYRKYYAFISQHALQAEHAILTGYKDKIALRHTPDAEMFVKTDYRKYGVRDRLIRRGWIPYECAHKDCITHSMGGIWREQPIRYELDHIDGDPGNDELTNLRFLCLGCHSETPTYKRKGPNKEPKKRYFCIICAKQLCNRDATYCSECYRGEACFSIQSSIERTVENGKLKFEITKEELEKLIDEMPYNEIGKLFGVGGNAIKKRAKKLGINLKPRRGYWQKRANGKFV